MSPMRVRVGMRLWLATAFALISILSAGVVYLFGDRPRAVFAAIGVGVIAGFLIAAAIAQRVERLADAANKMADGSLDAPLTSRGHDEIGDLAAALEKMRASLQESFGV